MIEKEWLKNTCESICYYKASQPDSGSFSEKILNKKSPSSSGSKVEGMTT